ncbi:jg11763 [Pararge aegeria aegeria]|uniref:Jg11763 protein n=1 Tax=Pararge aegeria aegeria TaxID=348720 RepID=A0A8S4SAU7_9NEOP|nr:jg11763 [Pararge aegeria aegeria]
MKSASCVYVNHIRMPPFTASRCSVEEWCRWNKIMKFLSTLAKVYPLKNRQAGNITSVLYSNIAWQCKATIVSETWMKNASYEMTGCQPVAKKCT